MFFHPTQQGAGDFHRGNGVTCGRGQCGRDLRKRGRQSVGHIDAYPHDRPAGEGGIAVIDAFCQDATAFFAVKQQVIDPLDTAFKSRRVGDGISDGHRGGDGQRGRVGGFFAPYEIGEIHAAFLRGKSPSHAAAAARLLFCQHGSAVGGSVKAQAAQVVVGGAGLGEDRQSIRKLPQKGVE